MGPLQKSWIEALRSGDYEQGHSYLCRDDKFCCLGVACDILEVPYELNAFGHRIYHTMDCVLPQFVADRLGLFGNGGDPVDPYHHTALFLLNDNGKTFAEIADIMEKNPEQYFKEER